METKEKFYNRIMWLMLFLFAPIGIYLLWKNSKYDKKSKKLLTFAYGALFVSVISIFSLNSYYNRVNQTTNENKVEYTVYITNTGSKYHRSGCSYLKSSNAIDLSKAKRKGYTPCSKCNPPR